MIKKYKSFILLVVIGILFGCSGSPKDPYADISSDELLSKSRIAMSKEQYNLAVRYLEVLEKRLTYGATADEVQLNLIRAYHQLDKNELGIATADNFIANHKASQNLENLDEVIYLHGLMNYKMNDSFLLKLFKESKFERDTRWINVAYNDFSLLVQAFPKSPFVKDAQNKITEIDSNIVEKEYKIINYYFNKKAYVSVINRGLDLYHAYPKAHNIVKILILVRNSYNAIDLRDSAAKIDAYIKKYE